MKDSVFSKRIELPDGNHLDVIGPAENHVPELVEIDESGDDDKIVDPPEQGE